ncbi:MAG: GNAT family N-acetyltransferase [Solirubrobacteraceae bacterium]
MVGVSVLVMELYSDGIVLRSWHPGDAARVFEVCQDPQIQHWLPTLPRPYREVDARGFVTDALGLGPYQLAVVEAGSVVGSVGLHLAKHETGGIGYWCAPEARGRGLTTRAVRMLCRYGLVELGLERLQLTADVDNCASQRVAEKVGFRREGVIRSHLRHPNGQRRDSALFSLLPGELP